MKDIIKFAITLGLIAAITGLALAVVFQITKPIIQAQDEKALQEGLQSTFIGNYDFVKLDKPIPSLDPSVQIGDSFLVKDKIRIPLRGWLLLWLFLVLRHQLKCLWVLRKTEQCLELKFFHFRKLQD